MPTFTIMGSGIGYSGGKNVSIGWETGMGALATSAEKHNTQIIRSKER